MSKPPYNSAPPSKRPFYQKKPRRSRSACRCSTLAGISLPWICCRRRRPEPQWVHQRMRSRATPGCLRMC
ncbi:MAG: hypothetical protein B7Y73_10210, partial [Acidocella sp. 35-58-6]